RQCHYCPIRHEVFGMNAGKKGRQAIFHNSACLPFASLQLLVLLAQRYPLRLFSKSRKGNSKTQQYKGGGTMKAFRLCYN
ncbi:MAG: hypothetical protein L6371_04105, partial [Candidatus Atribacteria bacterium]|nr:hypothetical protein [Candidatus Atribacteria bacterium]